MHQKLMDYMLLAAFAASIFFAVSVMIPGMFGKSVNIAATIPWATWRL